MKTGHGKWVEVEESAGAEHYRWTCAVCYRDGQWVRSKEYARELGDRHADKFKTTTKDGS